jgi:hypothetical protein
MSATDGIRIKKLVITRFNNEPREGGRWKNPAWLKYRLALMEKTAARSIENQANRAEFEWVILVAPGTEQIIIDLLNGYHIAATWCYDYLGYRLETKSGGFDEVFEARLDCDDCISPGALSKLWREVSLKGCTAAWLGEGYVFNTRTREIAESVFRNGASPAFLTYRFPVNEWVHNREGWLEELGGTCHTKAARFPGSIKIFGPRCPKYLITYHGDNLTDQWRNHGGRVLSPDEAKKVSRAFNLKAVRGVTESEGKSWDKIARV